MYRIQSKRAAFCPGTLLEGGKGLGVVEVKGPTDAAADGCHRSVPSCRRVSLRVISAGRTVVSLWKAKTKRGEEIVSTTKGISPTIDRLS